MSDYLFKFSVNKKAEVEEEKKEVIRNEAGEETIRTYRDKTIKDVPVEIAISKPTRRQRQDSQMEYSVEFSKWIKKGVLTKAMLMNRYSDTGGIISQAESKVMFDLTEEINAAQGELLKLGVVPEAERDAEHAAKVSAANASIFRLRKQLIEKETAYITLFEHTADVKAQNHTVLWWILHLTQIKDSPKSEFRPMFPGKTMEDREEVLYKLEDSEAEIFNLSFKKIMNIISYWYFTGVTEQEEYERIIQDVNDEKA